MHVSGLSKLRSARKRVRNARAPGFGTGVCIGSVLKVRWRFADSIQMG
jgi:hypothetical protein